MLQSWMHTSNQGVIEDQTSCSGFVVVKVNIPLGVIKGFRGTGMRSCEIHSSGGSVVVNRMSN